MMLKSKKNIIWIVALGLFLGLCFWWQSFYNRFELFLFDNTFEKQAKAITKKLNRKLFFDDVFKKKYKKVDFYVANFESNNLISKNINNDDSFKIAWVGSFNEIDNDNIVKFDVILASSPHVNIFLKSLGLNSFYFPYVLNDNKLKNSKCSVSFENSDDCFFVVVGNVEEVEVFMKNRGVPFIKIPRASKDNLSKIYKDIDKISGFIVDDFFYHGDGIDLSPIFIDAIVREIPILFGNMFRNNEVDFSKYSFPLYMGDFINYFTYRSDIYEFFQNPYKIHKRAVEANVVGSKFVGIDSAVDRIYELIKRGNFEDYVIKDSVNIFSPTIVGLYNNGDYWIADDLKDGFYRQGKMSILSFAQSYLGKEAEVYIYIRGGMKESSDVKKDNKISLMYLLYPFLGEEDNSYNNEDEYLDDIIDEMKNFDGVVVSSNLLSDKLKKRNINAHYIPQFTNTNKFYYDYVSRLATDVLFVGNATFYRKAPNILLDNGIDVTIYGDGWHDSICAGKYIDNKILRKYYSSAKIVLNDTRDEMKNFGFISNRIFDATASGALVISDYMKEIEEVYGDSVLMWKTDEELVQLVKYYLDPKNEEERLAKAKKAQQITLENFTIDRTIDKFNDVIDKVKKLKNI